VTDSQSLSANRAGSPTRRRELIQAARKRFLADGFGNTTVSSIVREAGVAQGTFYLYFKSKEQVLVHLRAEILADFVRVFESGIERRGPADARLVRGLREIYSAVRRNRPLIRVVRQAISGEEAERVWIEGRSVLAAPLGELIALGVEDGSFAVDDAQMAAHLMLSLFDDLLYEALEYQKPASGKRTLNYGSRFLLRALGVAPARIDELVPRTGTRK
jgi:AcrR family transcriptional regulator